MSIFEAIILGIVQGLTEFLPISSSGHLRIVPAIAGWPDPGSAFTAVIQLGTMAAVVIYFRKDIWEITSAFVRGLVRREREGDAPHIRMGWYLGLGTLPIIVFGVLFKDQIESGARNLYLIGSALIIFGIILGIVDATAKRVRKLDSIKPPDAAIVGVAQALALVPGVSRSGSTITFGLLRGFTREDAARFSFLLSIPAVVLSGLLRAQGRDRTFDRRRHSGADHLDDRLVHRRLLVDRVPAQMADESLDGDLRRVSVGAWRPCDCPHGQRSDLLRAANAQVDPVQVRPVLALLAAFQLLAGDSRYRRTRHACRARLDRASAASETRLANHELRGHDLRRQHLWSLDPWFMVMIIRQLGDDYVVWDKSARVTFKRPGTETLYAVFELPRERSRGACAIRR